MWLKFFCVGLDINMIALLLGLGVLEIAVWWLLAQFISGWYVFFWFIAALLIGLKLLRHSSRILMPQMQQMQRGGQVQSLNAEMRPAIAQLLAGILLIIPGVITDVMALLLLIPFVQKRMADYALAAFAKRQQMMMQRMMQQQGFNQEFGNAAQEGNAFGDLIRQMQQQRRPDGSVFDGDIIEGEAREIEPEVKKIDHQSLDKP